jgi:hypothetical protein
VVLDSLDSHWLKRPVADVKSDLRDFDAATPQAVEQFRSEMQTCGWSGDGAPFARKYRLISLGVEAVFFVALDVRRKRRPADAIDDFVEVACCFKAHDTAAAFAPLEYFSGELAPGELNSRAWQH